MQTNFIQRMSAAALIIAAIALAGCKKDSPVTEKDPVKVSSISLNKPTLTLTAGTSETLTATVAPDSAENQAVTWKSDKTGVAAVDAEGKVTAVAEGTATISVTTLDGNFAAASIVTVEAEVVPVMLCGVEVAAVDLPGNYTWYTATAACPPGWRLPTLSELKCICGHRATIGGFANPSDLYWTSDVYNDCYAYTVWYSNGMIEELRPSMDYAKGFVRCVRSRAKN